jgi:hypothetical protein
MPDYQNGVIYLIYVGDLKYVGSTCDFDNRRKQHKHCLNNPNSRGGHLKVYKAIRENGNEWRMEIYKQFPCNSEKELKLEEERIRKELGAELNDRCCGTGLSRNEYHKHYHENNREKIRVYKKHYAEKNKEKISERQKEYREQNKEMLCEQSKEYREQNKEKKAEYDKQHREKNREKIRELNAQNIECPICGLIVRKYGMKRHQRSAKCQRIAEQRAEEI